jgi:hypothetical protein
MHIHAQCLGSLLFLPMLIGIGLAVPISEQLESSLGSSSGLEDENPPMDELRVDLPHSALSNSDARHRTETIGEYFQYYTAGMERGDDRIVEIDINQLYSPLDTNPNGKRVGQVVDSWDESQSSKRNDFLSNVETRKAQISKRRARSEQEKIGCPFSRKFWTNQGRRGMRDCAPDSGHEERTLWIEKREQQNQDAKTEKKSGEANAKPEDPKKSTEPKIPNPDEPMLKNDLEKTTSNSNVAGLGNDKAEPKLEKPSLKKETKDASANKDDSKPSAEPAGHTKLESKPQGQRTQDRIESNSKHDEKNPGNEEAGPQSSEPKDPQDDPKTHIEPPWSRWKRIKTALRHPRQHLDFYSMPPENYGYIATSGMYPKDDAEGNFHPWFHPKLKAPNAESLPYWHRAHDGKPEVTGILPEGSKPPPPDDGKPDLSGMPRAFGGYPENYWHLPGAG